MTTIPMEDEGREAARRRAELDWAAETVLGVVLRAAGLAGVALSIGVMATLLVDRALSPPAPEPPAAKARR